MSAIFTSTIAARTVVTLRIVIGTVCVFRALEEWRIMMRVFRPSVIRFPVFEWLPIVNSRIAFALLTIWLISSVLFTIGWHVRVAGFVLAVTMGATLFMDQQLYTSHLYLLTLEVLLLAVANPTNKIQWVPYWPILLLKLQLSFVYFFAALSKINSEYLSGFMIGVNLRMSVPPRLLPALAVGSIVVELFLAFAFWTRLRKLAVFVGVSFHIVMVAFLHPVVIAQLALFAVACLAIYPLFFIEQRPGDQT